MGLDLQLVEDDAYAIVSARMNNAIYKLHVESFLGLLLSEMLA